jgi:hypothetical protein
VATGHRLAACCRGAALRERLSTAWLAIGASLAQAVAADMVRSYFMSRIRRGEIEPVTKSTSASRFPLSRPRRSIQGSGQKLRRTFAMTLRNIIDRANGEGIVPFLIK